MSIRQVDLRDEFTRLTRDLIVTCDALAALRRLYLIRCESIIGLPIRRAMETIHENLPTVWFTLSEMEGEIVLRNPGHGKKSLNACIVLAYKQLIKAELVQKRGEKKLASYRLKQPNGGYSI